MRALLAVLVSVLPNAVKLFIYRHGYGYRIGRGVRIGLSPLLRLGQCTIEAGVRIGHGNFFCDVGELVLCEGCRIGQLNLFRGGERIRVGRYASVGRLNVINSIRNAEVMNERRAICEIGAGAVLTTAHWVDFTDRVTIGHNVIVGGRNSSLWTHSRQTTRPIHIAHHCYLGSEVKVAPGVWLAPLCVAAIGSVLMGEYRDDCSLLVGNPATVRRPLGERDWCLVSRRNREDIPDEVAYLDLDAALKQAAQSTESLLRRGLPANEA